MVGGLSLDYTDKRHDTDLQDLQEECTIYVLTIGVVINVPLEKAGCGSLSHPCLGVIWKPGFQLY